MTKQDIVDDINRAYPSVMITHREELVDQTSGAKIIAAPPGRLVWPTSLDDRVRPEHRNINHDYGSVFRMNIPIDATDRQTRTVARYLQRVGRALRPAPDRIHVKHPTNGREYVVYSKKIGTRVRFMTKFFGDDAFYMKQAVSKRKSIAIAKGEEWLNNLR